MIDADDGRPLPPGRRAEELALYFLQRQGLTPITRNFRCRGGEIDLVMRDGRTTVFVEVRYRANDRYGSAAESIDVRKQARLIAAARFYLHMHRSFPECLCRFDAVVLSGDLSRPLVEWITDAFQA